MPSPPLFLGFECREAYAIGREVCSNDEDRRPMACGYRMTIGNTFTIVAAMA